jgi:hypothetical protein
MLRLLFTALFVLFAAGSAAAELGGRLLGVLLTLQPHEAIAFTVSPERQTVYAVTWLTETAQSGKAARLHVIGVSDPTAPHLLADIPLGDFLAQEIIARSARLFVLARAKSPDASVIVVDLRAERAPVAESRVPLADHLPPAQRLYVAEDGSCFAIGNLGRFNAFGNYSVDRDGKAEPGPCAWSKLATPLGGPERALDRRGPDSLVWADGRLLIRTTTGAKTAEHGVYVLGAVFSDAKFLASSETLVALAGDAATAETPGPGKRSPIRLMR